MNNALAERVIRVLEEHPELHSQRTWVSRSVTAGYLRELLRQDSKKDVTACAAGWICAFTLSDKDLLQNQGTIRKSRFHLGSVSFICKWARDALEISQAQADWMFSENRTRAEVLQGLRWLQMHPNADLMFRAWEIKPPVIARDENRTFLDLIMMRNLLGLRGESYRQERSRQLVR